MSATRSPGCTSRCGEASQASTAERWSSDTEGQRALADAGEDALRRGRRKALE